MTTTTDLLATFHELDKDGDNPPYVPKSKPSPFGAVEATWAKAMVACLQCKAA